MEKTKKELESVELKKSERIEIKISKGSYVEISKGSEGSVVVNIRHHQTNARDLVKLGKYSEMVHGSSEYVTWSKCKSLFRDTNSNVEVHHTAFNKW